MKLYLLSIYQPDGGMPPPEFLARVMRDISAMNRELKAHGCWVFAGGLHPPRTATVGGLLPIPRDPRDLLRRLGRNGEAIAAYRSAVERCGNAVERAFLERRTRAISSHHP